jgi:multicomponent Na+:H+ antiporter subunit G
MSYLLDLFSIAAIVAGAVFYLAGTMGLLRFPDAYNRLHALTKADNLGLALIVLVLLQTLHLMSLQQMLLQFLFHYHYHL